MVRWPGCVRGLQLPCLVQLTQPQSLFRKELKACWANPWRNEGGLHFFGGRLVRALHVLCGPMRSPPSVSLRCCALRPLHGGHATAPSPRPCLRVSSPTAAAPRARCRTVAADERSTDPAVHLLHHRAWHYRHHLLLLAAGRSTPRSPPPPALRGTTLWKCFYGCIQVFLALALLLLAVE